MNIAIWVLAGGLLGWIGFPILRANADRGRRRIVPIIIGAVGGLFGGNVLVPMLGAAANTPNDFSMFSLVIALSSAAGCLVIGNLIFKRYGV